MSSIVENFFSQVKSEFYYINQFESVDDFIIKLTEYLNYYNIERLPLKFKGLTPIQYRNQSLKSSFI